jgi:hypothetical protein
MYHRQTLTTMTASTTATSTVIQLIEPRSNFIFFLLFSYKYLGLILPLYQSLTRIAVSTTAISIAIQLIGQFIFFLTKGIESPHYRNADHQDGSYRLR